MLLRPLETGFFLFLFLSVYSYGIYPWLLFLLAKLKRNDWILGEGEPIISIVISVYNEEGVIREKIRNTLELEYPVEKLEIIISSDGSIDRTNQIVSSLKDPRLVLKAFPERSGKTACLNRVVPEAKGEIVIFTDANSMFPKDMLVKMVRNFADPQVGLVTGWTKYRDPDGSEATSGVYARLERITKDWESLVSSCVGADGAAFGMRKSLYQSLREEDINDFILPLRVVGQGKRVVMDPEVYCFEEPTQGAAGEYRRQIRISTRTLGAVRRNLEFLNPFKFGSFSFFLISHKIMRFLVPFFLIGTIGMNFFLLGNSFFFILTLTGQLFFLLIGALSLLNLYRGKAAGFIKFFLITMAAQLVGWFRMLAGVTDTVWTSQR